MKIIADPQSRTYELTYLVPATYTESELATIKERVNNLIVKREGKIVETKDWGKKNLAYNIKYKSTPQTQAYYIHQVIEMLPDQAPALEKDIYLDPQVMRHLMIKVEVSSTVTKSEVKENQESKE